MDPDGKRRNPIVVGIHIGRRGSSGLFWGAFLVLGGVALLLDRMGYVSVDRLWRFWPLILILTGALLLRDVFRGRFPAYKADAGSSAVEGR